MRALARSHAVIDADASWPHQPFASNVPTASEMRAQLPIGCRRPGR
jgi:hypothetical protein